MDINKKTCTNIRLDPNAGIPIIDNPLISELRTHYSGLGSKKNSGFVINGVLKL